MSFFIGAGAWQLVAAVLGVWWYDAQRNWLSALARHGRIPESADGLQTKGLVRPRRSTRTIAAISRESYPTTRASEHNDVERWRIRRKRRRTVFLVWMFGGIPFAIALMASVEVVQDEPVLSLIYVPVLAIAFFVARTLRSYGNHDPRLGVR